jgi:hypothetical protein
VSFSSSFYVGKPHKLDTNSLNKKKFKMKIKPTNLDFKFHRDIFNVFKYLNDITPKLPLTYKTFFGKETKILKKENIKL